MGSLALAGVSMGANRSNIFEAISPDAAQDYGWYLGLCKMCMQGDCQMRVHVTDGVVVGVEGDPRGLT